MPQPAALVPLDNVQNKVLRESLARLAEAVVSGGFAADSPRRAAFDLLRRVPPRNQSPGVSTEHVRLRRPGRPRCPGGSPSASTVYRWEAARGPLPLRDGQEDALQVLYREIEKRQTE